MSRSVSNTPIGLSNLSLVDILKLLRQPNTFDVVNSFNGELVKRLVSHIDELQSEVNILNSPTKENSTNEA